MGYFSQLYLPGEIVNIDIENLEYLVEKPIDFCWAEVFKNFCNVREVHPTTDIVSRNKWFLHPITGIVYFNWWEVYNAYLESEEWQQKRMAVLERDCFLCLSCGDNATEVHHLTYARVGDESIEDLLSFCHRCHTIQHGREFN